MELHDRPRQRTGLHLVPEDGGGVLTTGDGERVVAMNETATALWEICDGRTSVAEMVDAVMTLFALDMESARGDVLRTLDRLHRLGVLAPREPPVEPIADDDNERPSPAKDQ